MADIFISYSSADRHLAEALAKRLEAAGFSVWWDTLMLGGVAFRNAIVAEIAASRCVIVIWTKHSVGSDWVYDEATRGWQSKKLIPLRVDQLAIGEVPPPFGALHTPLLDDWAGLLRSISRLAANVYDGLAEEGAEASVNRVPRFDGVYFCKRPEYTYYLRFYEDGTVIQAGSTGTLAQIAGWFAKDHEHLSVGNYSVKGEEIFFFTKSSAGTVQYMGEFKGDIIKLSSVSHINHNAVTLEYAFAEAKLR